MIKDNNPVLAAYVNRVLLLPFLDIMLFVNGSLVISCSPSVVANQELVLHPGCTEFDTTLPYYPSKRPWAFPTHARKINRAWALTRRSPLNKTLLCYTSWEFPYSWYSKVFTVAVPTQLAFKTENLK